MNVVFRVDSGLDIGTGHLVRCLTLAKLLREKGAKRIFFICRPHQNNISEMVLESNFTLLMLPFSSKPVLQNNCKTWLGESKTIDASQTHSLLHEHGISYIDILIVDHYAIDYVWEMSFSEIASKIMVIDDLADRKHECDVLLDQNIAPNQNSRYLSLIPSRCEIFIGISYCLLDKKFFNLRQSITPRSVLKKLLIFFGGVDMHGCTERLLIEYGKKFENFKHVDVVVGMANPKKSSIEKLCSHYDNCHYHEQISNMAELIANADFSIGACGAVTGERIFLGLPSIIVSLAENQLKVSQHLHELRNVYYIGDHSCINLQNIENAIHNYLGSHDKISNTSNKLISMSNSKLGTMIDVLMSRD